MNEEEVALEALKYKIRTERGFNAHIYKDMCIRRRLAVRMLACGCDDFRTYAERLDADGAEYDRLIATLTINVTRFFRNAGAWELLREEVISRLLDHPSDRPIRAWSAGCASGEEAYSLSILFHEVCRASGREDALARIRILGTDIDGGSLAAAREASYPELSFAETPANLRARWFSPEPPFELREEARRNVRFENADLISDAMPARLHLIVCRNVLIYFDRPTQERLFHAFHDALVPGGFLFLGRVESLLGRARGLFRPVSTRERIYRTPT
jgi:chemotaxis methyl-accepting protein methylase